MFYLGPDGTDMVSTSGSGLQAMFLANQIGAGPSTITGSEAAGALNVYDVVGDSTVGGAAYVITNFGSPQSVIYLVNGSADGPALASVLSITQAGANALVTLTDNTRITLLGIEAATIYTVTCANGVEAIS
jgi:hypothetical protein